MTMSRPLLTFIAIALAAGSLAGQIPIQQPARDPGSQPQTGTSVITGTVLTTDDSNQPVRRALVSINGGGLRNGRQAVTDSAGRFAVTDLPSGSFTLSVSKPSFINTTYGSTAPNQPGTPIEVKAGQRVDVNVRMPRGAVLSGSITDPFGRPRPQVRVQAFMYRISGGQRRLQQTGTTLPTDDRGTYRIYGLPAGDYVVVAVTQENQSDVRMITTEELRWAQGDGRAGSSPAPTTPPPPPAATTGYVPLFFPGVFDISAATTLTLTAGEERLGLDMQLQRTQTAKIEGVLVDPDGRVPQQSQVTLLTDERLRGSPLAISLGLSSENARVDQMTGKFTFVGVPPGHYTIAARSTIRPAVNENGPLAMPVQAIPPGRAGGPPPVPPPPAPPTVMWAMAPIDVSGRDLSGVAMTLQPGLSISGRVVFEASTQPAPPDLTRVRLSASPIETLPIAASVPGINAAADGTFLFRGALPGRYRLNGSVPGQNGPWTVKSVVANGRETMDVGLEIGAGDLTNVVMTFTDRISELSGTLFDAAGVPTREYWVLVFSTDRNNWIAQSRRSRVVRPGQDGRFRLPQWPPGEYYMVAVTDGDQMDLTDRTTLEQIAAIALKITLAEGEKKVTDLKLSR